MVTCSCVPTEPCCVFCMQRLADYATLAGLPVSLTCDTCERGEQAYANLGVTCPTTKAFLLAMAEEACARESYKSVTQAGWALTVIQALPEDMLRRVSLIRPTPSHPKNTTVKTSGIRPAGRSLSFRRCPRTCCAG